MKISVLLVVTSSEAYVCEESRAAFGLYVVLNFSGRYFITRYRRIELLAEAFQY